VGTIARLGEARYDPSDPEKVIISGSVEDKSGVAALFINDQRIPIESDKKEVSFKATLPDADEFRLSAYNGLGKHLQIPMDHPSFDKSVMLASTDLMAGGKVLCQQKNPLEIEIYTWAKDSDGIIESKKLSDVDRIEVFLRELPIILTIKSQNGVEKVDIDGVVVSGKNEEGDYEKNNIAITHKIKIIHNSPLAPDIFTNIKVTDTTKNVITTKFKVTEFKEIKVKKLEKLSSLDSLKKDGDIAENVVNMLKAGLKNYYQCQYENGHGECTKNLKKIIGDYNAEIYERILAAFDSSYKVNEYNIRVYLDKNGKEILKDSIIAREKECNAFKQETRYGIFVFPFFSRSRIGGRCPIFEKPGTPLSFKQLSQI